MPEFRLAVTGGRDYQDEARVFAALDLVRAKRGDLFLILGCARGADALARKWALARSQSHRVLRAHWKEMGPAAGPERNARMVAEQPQGLCAFPGGDGTADMTQKCRAAGVPVWEPYR